MSQWAARIAVLGGSMLFVLLPAFERTSAPSAPPVARPSASIANVDTKTATQAEIAKIRKIQIGYQVDGITGGLAVQDQGKKGK